jgi:hypothetical protein
VSLLSVIPVLLSDAPTLTSGNSSEPKSPPLGAKLVALGGDPFVDLACEVADGVKQIITSIMDVEHSRV